jgi:uncharacterized protein YyaL (SSP411 family)
MKNRLKNTNNLYLKQHENNPVDWYSWGEEPFEKAKQENKLVLVSIGYSACHWCHVMAEESYNDPDIARIMNENFINIKVDREEHPDVDNYYMNAVQLMTGRGGWPLNCFALPDGKPVYGGTYFPKENWKELLINLALTYKNEPDRVYDQGNQLHKGIAEVQLINPLTINSSSGSRTVKEFMKGVKNKFDINYGGFNGAPKFPLPVFYLFLLKQYFFSKDEELLDHLNNTLTNMAKGGIYDQLGGGFSRYSVDENWNVPHFEKMLYDNAQLASLYSKSYLLTGDVFYKDIATEVLYFMKNEMRGDENYFFSSIDADSEGEEGKFYTWKEEEIDFSLGNNADLLKEYYGISGKGEINGRHVLRVSKNVKRIAEENKLDKEKVEKILQQSRDKLLEIRSERKRPQTDKKGIISWNSLAIKSFVDGYRATGKKTYLRIALSTAEFILNHHLEQGYKLKRIYLNGETKVDGFMDDYAFFIDALIELYQVTFDEKWIDWAYKLTNYTIHNFYNQNNELFNYYANDSRKRISNSNEITDSVIPSSNAVMAKVLYILGQLFYTDSFIEMAEKMPPRVNNYMSRNPAYYAQWLSFKLWLENPPNEISILGKKFDEYKEDFNKIYHPGIILAGGSHEGNIPILKGKFKLGKTKIYICQGRTCQEPLNTPDEALKMIV